MHYWLFKSERECYSIYDLEKAPSQTTSWDGVRNYQARNFMRDEMKIGDFGFFYHSGKSPELAGIIKVVRESYPDYTAQDPQKDHYDPTATPENPRWYMVDVQLVQIFQPAISRNVLRLQIELAGMELLKIGSRLSVQPVLPEHFATIVKLADNLEENKEFSTIG